MQTPRNRLTALIEQGGIPEEKIPDAIDAGGLHPDEKEWRRFSDRLLLWSGGLSLAFSLMFFIAYNWSRIGHLFKFAMVEICIILAVAVYWKTEKKSSAAKVSLMAATICLGVLLALYGQTYQTGADPWELFFNWALLMLPWAVIGRFPAIWVLWLFLINLSVTLYFNTFGSFFRFLSGETALYWYIFIINTCALAVWEVAANRWEWLRERWPVRLLISAGASTLTLLVLLFILDDDGSGTSLLIWVFWLAGLYLVYRKQHLDLFMLSAGCLSGIVIVTTFVGKHILDDGEPGSFLLLAILVAGMGAGAAFWLNSINREVRS